MTLNSNIGKEENLKTNEQLPLKSQYKKLEK